MFINTSVVLPMYSYGEPCNIISILYSSGKALVRAKYGFYALNPLNNIHSKTIHTHTHVKIHLKSSRANYTISD